MTQLPTANRQRIPNAFFLTLTVLALVGLSLPALANSNPLVFLPQKPKQGEKVQVRYNPAGTPLAGQADIEAYVYLYEECNCMHPQPRAEKIDLKKTKDGFEGYFTTSKSTNALVVKFTKGELVDNNADKGYLLPLYDAKGKPVQGANVYLSHIASGSYGFATGVKGNKVATSRFAEEEFTLYPDSKKKYVFDYVGMLLRSGTEEDKAEALKSLEAVTKDPASNEEKLQNVQVYYQQLKDGAKAEEVKTVIRQRFPQGDWLKNEKIAAVQKEKELSKKAALYEEVLKAYPPKTEAEQNRIDMLSSSLAQAYADSGALDKMEAVLATIKNPLTLAGALNSTAWKWSGGGINEKPKNLELARKLSERSRQAVQTGMNTGKGKPSMYTAAEWQKVLQGNMASYGDTYALLLYQSGDYTKAYEVQKDAVKETERKRANLNEMYTTYVEKVKGPAEAQKELEAFLTEGIYTAKMKDQLKRLYTASHSEEQWQAYVAALEKKAQEAKRKELMGKLVNKPAPMFALRDMSGAEVALKDLKGKVVVVDFWATWCGPCINSFPGMQKMVDKYKDSKEVAFVFIDTWENIENREQVVKDFIAKKGYTFQVLFDQVKPQSEEFQVVSSFEVEGIPTKFVLDPSGRIAFKSVGYNANLEQMMTELDLMIDIARENK
jgi:thiol-disulfide isomerase/thioredoxin